MKSKVKKVLKSIIGEEGAYNLRNFRKRNRIWLFFDLLYNFISDFKRYFIDSTLFIKNVLSKKEANIILEYHRIEKGLLHDNTRLRFAEKSIKLLHNYLKDDEILLLKDKTQIMTAMQIMCQYYELHKKLNANIEDYFSEAQYLEYKRILGDNYLPTFEGTVAYNMLDFYKNAESDFFNFSNSRRSIRNFTGDLVEDDLIKKAVKLATNAPSVCNRQASKVYLVDDKKKIDKILAIQGGFSGYSQKVSQLLIVTTDRNYFYTIGERSQFFIDGGIFLMNLLYSLHFYKIANCPANWGKTVQAERKLSNVITLPKSEKIICLVPIGVAVEEFKVCLSKRRDLDEVLHKI